MKSSFHHFSQLEHSYILTYWLCCLQVIARVECANRASQLATSTPDKRRSPPFDEGNAALSPIPRMKSLNDSQGNSSHSDKRRGMELFSASESILSDTDGEKVIG